MKSKTFSLVLISIFLGVVGALSTDAKNKHPKTQVYYKVSGQFVSSTLTITCHPGLKRCRITVNGTPVELYRDPRLAIPVLAITDIPKSAH